MSDSDSDDDIYSNYTAKRRLKVAEEYQRKFKQQNQENVEKMKIENGKTSTSDDDDDIQEIPVTKSKKRKSDLDNDDDDDCIIVEKRNPNDYLESQVGKEYEEQLKARILEQEQQKTKKQANYIKSSAVESTYQICREIQELQNDIVESPINESFDTSNFDTDECCVTPTTVTINACDIEYFIEKTKIFDIKLNENFNVIYDYFSELFNCKKKEVVLQYNSIDIPLSATPESLGMSPTQIPYPKINGYKKKQNADDDDDGDGHFAPIQDPNLISLKIQKPDRRRPVEVTVNKNVKVKELIDLIHSALLKDNEKLKVNKKTMKLMFDDQYITDKNQTLDDLEIENGDCIDIY